MSLQSDLRHIIANYGLSETYHAFQHILKVDYEFLQGIFSTTHVVKVPESSQVDFTNANVEEAHTFSPALQTSKKIVRKVVKTKELDSISSLLDTVEVPAEVPAEVSVKTVSVKQVPPDAGTSAGTMPPKFETSREAKQWQKEQEEKKGEELRNAGINPETLLTKENLQQWIESEKKSYSYIARNLIGLPEYRIAEFAKQHNILSDAAKRRAAIMSKK